MLAVAHYFTCAVYVVEPFMNVTKQAINPLSLVAYEYLGDNKFIIQM